MNYNKILEYARSLRKNQTPAEKIFWEKVRNRRFLGLKFNRQFIIEHQNRSYFIADFHCFEKKIIVEIDGKIHLQQLDYDIIREDILKEMGYKILRFTNNEVSNDWNSVKEIMIQELSPNPSLLREGNKRGELKKIAIVGPESTGKSELSQQLARHFNTEWVPEYARFYLDRLDREYEKDDLLEIAKGQLIWEDDKAAFSNTFLICDTNLIVIKIWSDHKYGNTNPWIEDQLKSRKYDFYLLTNIDLLWRPDPQREHPDLRTYFFELYEKYLQANNLPYSLVSGIEGDRLKNAVDAISQHFNLT